MRGPQELLEMRVRAVQAVALDTAITQGAQIGQGEVLLLILGRLIYPALGFHAPFKVQPHLHLALYLVVFIKLVL
jgi:hypothetical protein